MLPSDASSGARPGRYDVDIVFDSGRVSRGSVDMRFFYNLEEANGGSPFSTVLARLQEVIEIEGPTGARVAVPSLTVKDMVRFFWAALEPNEPGLKESDILDRSKGMTFEDFALQMARLLPVILRAIEGDSASKKKASGPQRGAHAESG